MRAYEDISNRYKLEIFTMHIKAVSLQSSKLNNYGFGPVAVHNWLNPANINGVIVGKTTRETTKTKDTGIDEQLYLSALL